MTTVQERLNAQIRSQNSRYKAHCERGDGIFKGRRSQLEIRGAVVDYFRETDPETGLLNTAGYIVAPPRLGKTIVIDDNTRNAHRLRVAMKYLPLAAQGEQNQLCLHHDELEWVKDQLGMENTFSLAKRGAIRA